MFYKHSGVKISLQNKARVGLPVDHIDESWKIWIMDYMEKLELMDHIYFMKKKFLKFYNCTFRIAQNNVCHEDVSFATCL